MEPQNPENFNALGIIYLKYKKDYFHALNFFYKAHQLNPEETTYIFNLGKTYQILNQHKEAIFWYEKGLVFQPDNLEVLNDLAISYAEIGEFDKAITIWKNILKKDKNFKQAINNLKVFERIK